MSFDLQLSSGIVNTFYLLSHSISIDLEPSSIDLQAKHCINFNMATKYTSGCITMLNSTVYLHWAQTTNKAYFFSRFIVFHFLPLVNF